MAKRTYIGGHAAGPAEVWKGTITTTTTGHTYTLPITDEAGGSSTFSYALVGGDTTTTIAAASWATAWNASADPRFTPMIASSVAGQVILTARTPGTPFYPGTPAGTGTWSGTGITTANTGPTDAKDAANWAENVVPVATDDITIVSGSILFGLQQTAVWTGKVTVAPSFSGQIGSPGLRLAIAPSAFVYAAKGSASSFIDIGSANIALQINGTAAPASGFGLDIIGSNITTVTQNAGTVGIAVNAGETATVATVALNGGSCTTGSGVTLTSFNQAAGTGFIYGACTNASVDSGTLKTLGTGAITTVIVAAEGTFVGNSTGTITNLKRLGGFSDFMQSRTPRTVTNDTYAEDGGIAFDPNVLTITNGSQALAGSSAITWTPKAA